MGTTLIDINEGSKRRILRTTAVGIAFLMALATFSGCSGSIAGDGSSDSSTIFPSDLTVSSPFDVTEDTTSASSSSTSALVVGSSPYFVTHYAWATSQIDQILNGTTPASCVFDPSRYLTQEVDADCFGPLVIYEAHPDSSGPSDPYYNGTLPTGDVGIWIETNDTAGTACAAAQLNARMQSVRDKSLTSLMGLASLVCTANVNSLPLPSNSSLDLTTEMNALGITDVTFASASISHSNASGSDEWSYDIDLTYTPGADTHHIVVAMTHIPGSAPLEYQGRLSYRVNDTFTGGNCSSTDITYNGSLLYDRASGTDLATEVREGQFCNHDSDGFTSGLVDPSIKYPADPDGWGNNFSILTADYDPSTMDGDFAYSWQAGPQDNNARTFNIHTEDDGAGTQVGCAYYGFADDIETTDGNIDGFICNWAGPGNDHTLLDRAQNQEVSFDSVSGIFVVDSSDILYAPTVSCDYDGTGSFTYDSDNDGAVDTNPANVIVNGLVSATDADANGVFDEITACGFSAPSTPPNI